jgi:hypothetical protein
LQKLSLLCHLADYSQNHSPWVHAVLLGLHEKGLSQMVRFGNPKNPESFEDQFFSDAA